MNITTMKYNRSVILDIMGKYLYENLIAIVIQKNKKNGILKTQNVLFEYKNTVFHVFKK